MRTQDTHETTHVVSNPESLFEAAKFQWMITDLAISRGYIMPQLFSQTGMSWSEPWRLPEKTRPEHPSKGDPT